MGILKENQHLSDFDDFDKMRQQHPKGCPGVVDTEHGRAYDFCNTNIPGVMADISLRKATNYKAANTITLRIS